MQRSIKADVGHKLLLPPWIVSDKYEYAKVRTPKLICMQNIQPRDLYPLLFLYTIRTSDLMDLRRVPHSSTVSL